MTQKKGKIGSSFDDFLKEQDAQEETNSIAIKRVLAWQLEQAMKERHLSKTQMAKEMETSRAQLDRILDPDNNRIQLNTVIKAAKILGHGLRIELV